MVCYKEHKGRLQGSEGYWYDRASLLNGEMFKEVLSTPTGFELWYRSHVLIEMTYVMRYGV